MTTYGPLVPDGYIPRIVDRAVSDALVSFGGIELQGMRWSGKSWTALAFGNSITRVDDDPDLYLDDPELALIGTFPHIIDEWQDVPAIWNRVRHQIDDAANAPGQFLLTGSSTAPDVNALHSGAGRIRRIKLSTMTLFETGRSSGMVSLRSLFDDPNGFEPVRSKLGLAELAEIICQGGWPALQSQPTAKASRVIEDYLETFFEITVPRRRLQQKLARNIARSLARNVANASTLRTIANDARQEDSSPPSVKTVAHYIDEFVRNYLIEELAGWDAPIRSASRLRLKPKRYFADPSLAVALLGVNAERLCAESQLFGLLFETLAVHDLAVYVSALDLSHAQSLRYYSDADGLEVDAIIELSDGRWAAIEIKLGESKTDKAAASLLRLRNKIRANPAARNPDPEFLAVIVGKGAFAHRRASDGVYVIPLDVLGP